MDARDRHFTARMVLVLALAAPGWAASAAETVAPWQDDANLHDLCVMGGRIAYAVGDQGTVWRTVDGGTQWECVPVGQADALRSVSFLNERIGWVAGTRWQPYTGVEEGVIHATVDGGATWERLSTGQLPGIRYARCFSPEVGVAVCRPTAAAPSGVYRTQDGGETWVPLAGDPGSNWQVASFLHPELGMVAGDESRLSLVGGDQLLGSRLPAGSGRAIRGMTLQDDESGWLVGDGGLVLQTTSGGVSWSAPAGPLPDGIRHNFDFRTVAARAGCVLLAGAPGSVIWRSEDAGRSWQKCATGSSLPINRLQWLSDTGLLAVGEFGVIQRSDDAGKTWQVVRGTERRAAWLALIPDPMAAPIELGVKLSAEEGYRGVIWSASHRTEEGPLADDPRDRLKAASQAARVNVAGTSWQLPIDRPDLLQAEVALLQRWQARAEQQAPSVLVNELVRQLRTYRPDVVILPRVAEGDAVANFVQQAGTAALAQAADSTRALEQQELAGLASWKVTRVFQQLADGSRSDVTISADEYLPRLSSSVHHQAGPAVSFLKRPSTGTSIALRRVQPETGSSPHVGGLFAGIDVADGTPTRRRQLPINEQGMASRQRSLETERNFRAFSARAVANPQTAAQLVGQLPDVLRQLEADQAVMVMTDLASTYRAQSQFDLAEGVYLELIQRHADHPAAVDAMAWLLKYWSSAEIAWQRTRHQGQSIQRASHDTTALQQQIQRAAGLGGGFLATPQSAGVVLPAIEEQRNRVDVLRKKDATAPPDAVEAWRRRARDLAEQLQDQAPQLFQQPAVQLPLAALLRSSDSHQEADRIYRRFQQGAEESSGNVLALGEMWVLQPQTLPPQQLAICRRTSERPYLDGILSDPCWQEAPEASFGPRDAAGLPAQSSGLTMFAYDDEFLYVAALVKPVGERPVALTETADRDYDADLRGYDRLSFALDTDRDYVTWYELEVDERGQTSDRCWEDSRWNPQWYVAREVNADRWQIEVAIPWSELAASTPNPRDVWAISVVRTIPYEGYHGWHQPAQWPPQWNSFGLLRFE